MTVTLPNTAKADIFRRLAAALDINEAAVQAVIPELGNAYGLSNAEVIDVAKMHGWPRPHSLRRAAGILAGHTPKGGPTVTVAAQQPTTDTPAEQVLVSGLLEKAAGSHKARTRNLAVKISGLLDDLRGMLESEAEERAAREKAEQEKRAAAAEVERLRKQLREAEAKLRGGTTTKGGRPADDGPSAKEIRSWARNAGVDCPATGRVPATVREAYDAAHSEDAA